MLPVEARHGDLRAVGSLVVGPSTAPKTPLELQPN